MKIRICLDESDIKTTLCGCSLEIATSDDLIINLTEKAARELISDLGSLLTLIDEHGIQGANNILMDSK